MKTSLFALILPGLMLSPLAASAVALPDVPLPDLKPGLWQTVTQHDSGNPAIDKPITASQCLDSSAQAEAKQTAAAHAKKSCSKNETSLEGTAQRITEMVCKLDNGATMTTHAVTTFYGNDFYHTKMNFTYVPASGGLADRGATIDAKWLGPCTRKVK